MGPLKRKIIRTAELFFNLRYYHSNLLLFVRNSYDLDLSSGTCPPIRSADVVCTERRMPRKESTRVFAALELLKLTFVADRPLSTREGRRAETQARTAIGSSFP